MLLHVITVETQTDTVAKRKPWDFWPGWNFGEGQDGLQAEAVGVPHKWRGTGKTIEPPLIFRGERLPLYNQSRSRTQGPNLFRPNYGETVR